MREEKNTNHEEKSKFKIDKKKIKGFIKSKEFAVTGVTALLVLSMVGATIAIGKHNREEALDHAAEVYAKSVGLKNGYKIASDKEKRKK